MSMLAYTLLLGALFLSSCSNRTGTFNTTIHVRNESTRPLTVRVGCCRGSTRIKDYSSAAGTSRTFLYAAESTDESMSSAGRYSLHIVVLDVRKTLGTYTWDGESLPVFQDGTKGFDDLKLRCGAESCMLNGEKLEISP